MFHEEMILYILYIIKYFLLPNIVQTAFLEKKFQISQIILKYWFSQPKLFSPVEKDTRLTFDVSSFLLVVAFTPN